MNTIQNKLVIMLILFVVLLVSCKDLEEMNINPNGVDPRNAHPNLLLPTVITSTGQAVVGLGFGDLAGVMQHTQKDGWSDEHNAYEWSSQEWSGFYGTLRNAEEMLKKSEEAGLDFHKGVALIFKAYNFGMITDLWGDAPFSKALLGEEGGASLQPVFDSQKDIYTGILAMLEEANTLLSKGAAEYKDINPTQDVLYKGNVAQWRKFANSLALRYYMRLSVKEPATAKGGIEKLTADPARYPLILEAADDASFPYVGNSSGDSWPCNTAYDISETNWRRLKMCSTLVEKLQALGDPRLGVWASKIQIPLVIDPARPANFDQIIDGKRVIAQNVADKYTSTFGVPLDTDPEYVGLPPSWGSVPQAYNLNPSLEQAPVNPHASHISEMYKKPSGPLLQARLISAAEVRFILAEAALNGWNAGGAAAEHYQAGIKASFDTWGVSGSYASYIAKAGAAYNGTRAQIIDQKWIASWTSAAEAWSDYRRTGLPALSPGKVVKRNALPLRFYYGTNELNFNPANVQLAAGKLEITPYTAPDGKNSAWSKPWILQGTGKPW